MSSVLLPPSAEILDIGVQGNDVVLWYSFEDYDVHSVLHEFKIVGTGGSVPYEPSEEKDNPYWTYMKTVMDGSYVWHIYKK